MYSKKYRVVNVESNKFNLIHEQVRDSICHPAYLSVGERGWILYRSNDLSREFEAMHRLHTSIISSVLYKDNQIVIITENTKYVLELIEDD